MYSVNLVLELSLSFTKIGLADQFLEITLPCWKSSLRGRSRRFEKESPRSISWRKKGCCAIGRGGVKVVSAIGRGRVKGVSASELLPCRCLIKMPSKYCEVPLTPQAARLNVSLQPSAISCWWSRVIYLNIGRQSLDSPIRTAVSNMEILLFNKPGTESANNNYLCTLQIPLLLIWKDEICNKSMFELFSIQTSTSTRQKHFCMNEN